MLDANELRKGTTFYLDRDLYKVLEYQHHKPGRGNAIIRTKLRNLRTGTTISRNFLSGDRFKEAYVERRKMQYLYQDPDFYHFMDLETYEQVRINAHIVGEAAKYLKENQEYTVAMHGQEPLNIELPPAVELEVVDSELAVAGNTATGATKRVILETGTKVQVPLFVEVGDVIRVDTDSGEYVTRV